MDKVNAGDAATVSGQVACVPDKSIASVKVMEEEDIVAVSRSLLTEDTPVDMIANEPFERLRDGSLELISDEAIDITGGDPFVVSGIDSIMLNGSIPVDATLDDFMKVPVVTSGNLLDLIGGDPAEETRDDTVEVTRIDSIEVT